MMGDILTGSYPFFVHRSQRAHGIVLSPDTANSLKILSRRPEAEALRKALGDRAVGFISTVLTTSDDIIRANGCAVVDELERWMILLDPQHHETGSKRGTE